MRASQARGVIATRRSPPNVSRGTPTISAMRHLHETDHHINRVVLAFDRRTITYKRMRKLALTICVALSLRASVAALFAAQDGDRPSGFGVPILTVCEALLEPERYRDQTVIVVGRLNG